MRTTRTLSKAFFPLALLVLLATGAGAEEIQGYGPWTFGMTPAQVQAVEQHGPYVPVEATGGLETMNGDFGGQKTHVSFVFRPAGLYHIQIWAYSGGSYPEALAAFHRAYRHLVDTFGSVTSPNGVLPSDLSPEQLGQRLGARFSEPREALLPKIAETGSFDAQIMSYRIVPAALPPGRDIRAEMVRSPEMGLYYAFVFYRAPNLGKQAL